MSAVDDPLFSLFNFIGRLVCHQLPERTLWVGGRYLPVCARDTGAYIGLLVGYSLLTMRRKHAPGPPNLLMTLLMLAPMIVDAGTQWIGFRTSTNEVRLFTGLVFGTALAPLLVYTLSLIPASRQIRILKKLLPETTELDSKDPWLSNRSMIIGFIAAVAVYFVINSLAGSSNIIFYWSLTPLIVASVVWHILLLPIIIVILYAFSLKRTAN